MMAKNRKWATILIFAFGIASFIKGMASKDLQVLVNGSAVINCFPNRVLSVQWHHTPPGRSSSAYVYAGGNFYDPYKDRRFRLEAQTALNYTLFIANVTHGDAGLYECKDDVISGVFGSTQLIVLNSGPVCSSNMHPSGFIGPNKCDLRVENMTFGCAVSFAGKTPSLTWRSSFDGSQRQLNNSICTNQSNHIDCGFTLEADPEYDGTVFTCETEAPEGVRFKCSTEVVKVQHFSAGSETLARKVHDNVTCNARSNLETRYNWTTEKGDQYVFLSSNRTIVMHQPGVYRCDVEYSVRNTTCSFLASVVNASVDSTDEEVVTDSSADSQKEQGNVLAIVLPIVFLSIALLAVVVVFVVYAKFFKGNRNKRKSSIDDQVSGQKLPLIDLRRTRLDRIRPRLTEICSIPLIGTEIIRKLKVSQIINEGFDDVDAADGVNARSERLLSVVSERMDEAFDPFKEALAGISPTLEKYFEKGEIVAVDITTEMPDLDGRLSEAFNDAVINRSELFRELATYSICMVVAKPSNSIEVLVYCGESENMRNFIEIFNSGELERLLSAVLESLLSDAPSSSSAGSLEAKVYIRQKEAKLVEQFADRKDWLRDKSKIRKSSSTSTPSVGKRRIETENGLLPETSDEDDRTTPLPKKSEKGNVAGITERNWKEILRTNYADLLVQINSNGAEEGLEGEFRRLNLFTPLQIRSIWGHRSNIEKNRAILSLLERGDLNRFLAVRNALKESGQQPVVDRHLSHIKSHLQTSDSRYDEPLKERCRFQMLVNWNQLMAGIGDVDGLVDLITERQTLTEYQMAVLRDFTNGTSKVNYLLRLLETGSQQHFDDFCNCLEQNNQGHIVKKYLTPKSVKTDLDEIPESFKNVKIQFNVRTTSPIRGRVVVVSNRCCLNQNRSEMHKNETNLNVLFQEKLIHQNKPIFDGKLLTNGNDQEIQKMLETEQQSQKDYDVFLMFFFSYGNSREIFTTDGKSLKIDYLFETFGGEKCPRLQGKPKIFIIQTFERDGSSDSPSLDAKSRLSVKFNLKDDMAVVYATVKGEPKDGREVTGTLFTRCLLKVFFSKIEANFSEIINEVLELLRKRDQKIVLPKGDVQIVQQLATFQTTLRQKVFLVNRDCCL